MNSVLIGKSRLSRALGRIFESDRLDQPHITAQGAPPKGNHASTNQSSPCASGEARWALVSTPHGLLMGPKFRRTPRPVRDARYRPLPTSLLKILWCQRLGIPV